MKIISLSSIPPRFQTIGATLDSLLRQDARIDRINLYIPRVYRRFPDYDGGLPEVPEGVTIVRVEEDLGPASKILFAARHYRGQNCAILFCDDDRILHRRWARALFEEQSRRPEECVALAGKEFPTEFGPIDGPQPAVRYRTRALDWNYRARKLAWRLSSALRGSKAGKPGPRIVRRAGYAPILQGLGGVVVRPDFFDERDHDIPGLLWTVDDIWLSGALARKGIRIWTPADLDRPVPSERGERESLYDAVFEGAGREELNLRCLEHLRREFGIWPRMDEPQAAQ